MASQEKLRFSLFHTIRDTTWWRISFPVPSVTDSNSCRLLGVIVLGVALAATLQETVYNRGLAAPADSSAQHQQHSNGQIEVLYQAARRAEQNDDFVAAARAYEAILRIRPDLPEIQSNLGVAYYFQKKYREAIAQFQQALRKKPQLVAANLVLGLAYHQTHQFQQSIVQLQKAITLEPRNVEARLFLAASYMRLGKYREAIAQYRQRVKITPDDPELYYGLGWGYLLMAEQIDDALSKEGKDSIYAHLAGAEGAQAREDWTLAGEEYSTVLTQNPRASEVLTRLGALDLADGKWEHAADNFTRALSQDPSDYRAAFGLAEASFYRQDIRASLSFFEKALSIRPEYFQDIRPSLSFFEKALSIRPEYFEEPPTFAEPMPPEQLKAVAQQFEAERQEIREPTREAAWHFEQAVVARGQRHGEEEIYLHEKSFRDALEKIRARFSHASFVGLNLSSKRAEGMRLFRAARYEEAEPLLAETLKALPRDREARMALARCKFEMKQFDRIMDLLWPLYQAPSPDWEAAYWLGKTCQQLASAALVQIARIDPGSFRVHELLGESYRLQGSAKRAIEEYQEAIRRNPDAPGLHFNLGSLYWKEFNYDNAIPELEKELEVSPYNALAKALLGKIFASLHNPAKAIPYLRASLEIDPNLADAHSDLGMALEQGGQLEEAIDELQVAAGEDTSGSIHYRLFRLYQRLGQTENAKKALAASKKLSESTRHHTH